MLKKLEVGFANAKATHIFSAKLLAYMAIFNDQNFNATLLTTSLVFNNWALTAVHNFFLIFF